MTNRIATAEWADPVQTEIDHPLTNGGIWLGTTPTKSAGVIGYRDDRHVTLVSGNRGGKGTTIIINNLCLYPGSVVVVDPKGENATVTAARRGRGSEYCEGMGQAVHVLDPFEQATLDATYRCCFNPLDVLDAENDESIDEAGRIADALVVVNDGKEPFWDESARALVKGLILHILTSPLYEGRRNLVTLRMLITRGDWKSVQILRGAGHTDIPSAQALLWTAVANNPAYMGTVAGIGEGFIGMITSAPKQFDIVLQVANRNTEFIDSPAMQRCLAASDFQLSSLKTDQQGVSLYLCLPQRYMATHFRWLRMMISLTTTEMEKTSGKPATGFQTLMLLDEFAGLKRMEVIENAVAQIAGYGVKLMFVLQSLEQLKAIYKDNWETFLANSGLKIFFNIEDNFSRDYVSKQIGDTEIMREVHTTGENSATSEGQSQGGSRSTSTTQGTSSSDSLSTSTGTSQSASTGTSGGTNRSTSTGNSGGTNESTSTGKSGGTNRSTGTGSNTSEGGQWWPGFFYGVNWSNVRSRNTGTSSSESSGSSQGWSNSDSRGTSNGWNNSDSRGSSNGWSNSTNNGTSQGSTKGHTEGRSNSTSNTTGENWGSNTGSTRGRSSGTSETLHRRPLITPDEIGLRFASIAEKSSPAYPGLALVLVSGERPIVVRRINYFDGGVFFAMFDPHPQHEDAALPRRFSIPLLETTRRLDRFKAILNRKPELKWQCKVGQDIRGGEELFYIAGFPGTELNSPFSGRIMSINDQSLPSKDLVVIRGAVDASGIDPFARLDKWLTLRAEREAYEAQPAVAAARLEKMREEAVANERRMNEAAKAAAAEQERQKNVRTLLLVVGLVAVLFFLAWLLGH